MFRPLVFGAEPCSSSPLITRTALTCRLLPKTASYSRVRHARIVRSLLSGYTRILEQGQPTRARWIRPSAKTSRRRGTRPQRTHCRGSVSPTSTPECSETGAIGVPRRSSKHWPEHVPRHGLQTAPLNGGPDARRDVSGPPQARAQKCKAFHI